LEQAFDLPETLGQHATLSATGAPDNHRWDTMIITTPMTMLAHSQSPIEPVAADSR